MIKLTRLLPANSKPAPVLLAKIKKIPLTNAQRQELPSSFESDGEQYEVIAQDLRPLELNDLFLDDRGTLYAVDAASEAVYHVTGDISLMQQVVAALMMRGFRVMETANGFGVCADEGLGEALKQIGLSYEEVTEQFIPVPLPEERHCGCGCGHHHHHHEEGEECGCGCGHHHHHHHDDEEECGCGCGHHHHHDEEESCSCGCGHHHHDEEEACSCGCGHHHHDEEEECSCGCGHHHHDEGEECSCGHHH